MRSPSTRNVHAANTSGIVNFCIALCVLVFLPNFDIFVGTLGERQSLFEKIIPISTEVLTKWLPLILAVMAFPLFLISVSRIKTNDGFELFLGLIVVQILFGLANLLISGESFRGAVRSIHLIHLYLMAAFFAVGCDSSFQIQAVRKCYQLLLATAFAKVVFSVYQYFTVGGVEIVSGIESLEADGGVIGLWCFIGMASSIQLFESSGSVKIRSRIFHLIVALIFALAIAATFRRNIALRLILTSAIGMCIYFWLNRKLLAGLAYSALLAAAVAALVWIGLIFQFGVHFATERLFSLVATDQTTFAASNVMYIDDWSGWWDAVGNGFPLGTGTGSSYGITRSAGYSDFEVEPPLHTGAFELWASFGISGILFHLIFGLGLPVFCLSRCRRIKLKNPAVVAICAANILYANIWPFGPPYTATLQNCVLNALLAGILISETKLTGTKA